MSKDNHLIDFKHMGIAPNIYFLNIIELFFCQGKYKSEL